MWIESQYGLINSDYVACISSTTIVDSEDERFMGREYAVIITFQDGSTKIQRFGDDKAKADAAFRHYTNILITNTG